MLVSNLFPWVHKTLCCQFSFKNSNTILYNIIAQYFFAGGVVGPQSGCFLKNGQSKKQANAKAISGRKTCGDIF